MILKHLDKDNLHHAYLIEGEDEEIVPEVLQFLKSLGIQTTGNSDFCHIHLDSFKIEDARNLKSYEIEKGFSSAKKVFIISANHFLLEAQNSLLKMFEEPIENTHFFLIVPDVNSLLKTLVSRFYLIRPGEEAEDSFTKTSVTVDAEKFISMTLKSRIDFIKELLVEPEEEDEEGNEIVALDSTRSKALKFLNMLEFVLHKKIFIQKKFLKNSSGATPFNHFFKVREFLRQPGSSPKTLMESVALVVPSF